MLLLLLCFWQASVTGNLTVSFYDAEAGWGALGPVMLSARTNPQVMQTCTWSTARVILLHPPFWHQLWQHTLQQLLLVDVQ